MIAIDLRKAGKLAKQLNKLRSKALPFATQRMLNHVAFDARRAWIEQVGKSGMVIRNKYTERSIRVDRARGRELSSMQSAVGSTAAYMAKQEFGGQERAKGKHGVPIPTSSAAGQAAKTRPRTRMVRRKNWLSAIRLVETVPGSRLRRNAAAIRMARARTDGVAYLDLGKRKGLFRIPPGKRAKPRMLYDLTRKTVRVAPRSMLAKALRAISPNVAFHARRAIVEELKRAGFIGD